MHLSTILSIVALALPLSVMADCDLSEGDTTMAFCADEDSEKCPKQVHAKIPSEIQCWKDHAQCGECSDGQKVTRSTVHVSIIWPQKKKSSALPRKNRYAHHVVPNQAA
ncbi:MAG: hypothetical protein M1829_004095 [Trizodia sp. TS-e1964]|nr:MAG: hypothetical protein M1829_004095 [Trizodia sp. TS-e1964]